MTLFDDVHGASVARCVMGLTRIVYSRNVAEVVTESDAVRPVCLNDDTPCVKRRGGLTKRLTCIMQLHAASCSFMQLRSKALHRSKGSSQDVMLPPEVPRRCALFYCSHPS